MDVALLMNIFMVVTSDMASMKLLVKCGKVCKAWKEMAFVLHDIMDGMSLTVRYTKLALEFGEDVGENMLQLYMTKLAAVKARRREIEQQEPDEYDISIHVDAYDISIHLEMGHCMHTAMLYLSNALKEYLLDSPTMLLCVRQLSTLTDAYSEEIEVPLSLTRNCVWPLLTILQAHPTDSMLGSRVLALLRQISKVYTPVIAGYKSIHRAVDRKIARDIVSGFLARFSLPQAVGARFPAVWHVQFDVVREMLNSGEYVLTWIDDGTTIRSTDKS